MFGLLRLVFRVARWAGKEAVSAAIWTAASGGGTNSPQYQIAQTYPAPTEYKTDEAKEGYYASKFTQLVEPINADEINGDFYGNFENKFHHLKVKNAVFRNDTIFFRFYLLDEQTNMVPSNNGFLVNKKNEIGEVISYLTLGYGNFNDIKVYKSLCTLNESKYLLIASSKKNIALLSDESQE